MKNVIYKKLSNGVRVILEKDENVHSVFVKARYDVGGLDEKKGEEGISHFLEHLAFKGTSKKTALEITKEVESLGGSINAATGFNTTFYYIKSLKNDFSQSLNLLHEILTDSVFPENEIEKERTVIIQELLMNKDKPIRQINELHDKLVYAKSRMTIPLIGTLKNIKSFTRDQILDYYKRNYTADRLIISVIGNIDLDDAFNKIENLFSGIEPSKNFKRNLPKYQFQSTSTKKTKKSLNQIYYWLSWECPGSRDMRNSLLLQIFNNVLSFGMSSRLFTEIREKRNLVYSIFSAPYTYEDFGYFLIYSSTTKDKIESLELEVDNLIKSLINENKITEEEFNTAKRQFKAALLLEMETIEAKAGFSLSDVILWDRLVDVKEYIEVIESISLDDLNSFITKNIISVVPSKVFYGNF